MTYDMREKSAHDGSPVELYKFIQGSDSWGVKWLYTSGDSDITFNSELYESIPMSRTGIEQNQEIQSGSTDITVPRTNPLAGKFIAYNPGIPVWLTIYRYHRNDSDYKVHFIGRIVSVSFTDGQAVIKCSPVQSVLDRRCPKTLYQSVCNHVLYNSYCGLQAANYRISVKVEGITNNIITSSYLTARANDWATHGFASYGNDQYRMVIVHSGNTMTLLSSFSGLKIGEWLDVFAGCDRTESTCKNKFGNITNYLGWTQIPTKNPFGGSVT